MRKHTSSLRTAYALLAAGCLAATTGCSLFHRDDASQSYPWPTKRQVAASDAEDPSSNPNAALVKGQSLERTGKLDKARETYERLLTSVPNQPEVMHRLAVVADKQRRHPEAQGLYAEVIRINPNNTEAYNDLGWSFYLSGDLAKAESAIAKAVQREPDNSRFRNNLGLVIGQAGRMQEAFEHFARAGSDADAHYNVAFIYASRNEGEEAKLCFHRALAANPQHAKAAAALASFTSFEQNGGMALDENYTADGRRLVEYKEDANGRPDLVAWAQASQGHAAPMPQQPQRGGQSAAQNQVQQASANMPINP